MQQVSIVLQLLSKVMMRIRSRQLHGLFRNRSARLIGSLSDNTDPVSNLFTLTIMVRNS